MKKKLIRIGGILLLGVWIGVSIADPPTEYVPVEEVVTETVTETVTVEASLPDACADMIYYTKRIVEAATIIDNASTQQLDIISDGRMFIAQHDTQALNNLEDRQRVMERETLAAIAEMAELKLPYEQAVAACKKETRYE